MLTISLAIVLGQFPIQSSPQKIVQNRGKLGTWYWRNTGANMPTDEDQSESDQPYLRGQSAVPGKLASVSFGKFRSTQVNVDSKGRNILGDAANEPSFVIDPTNRNHIAVGWRQFDNVASNFRQAGNAYSLDGGASWKNNVVITPGLFRSDPVLASDSTGNFYYNSLQQTFYTDVFSSTPPGLNWLFKGPATGGDKQWMTCDRTSGPGRGNLYESWSTAGNNYGGRQFSRSTNGGASWLEPINIPGYPIWGTLDVATNGDLYLCGLGDSSFSFCRSSDAQNPQIIPTFDRVVPVDLGGAIVFGASINPAGLMGQSWIATDKSKGLNAGNIYMLCSVGVDNGNPCQVNFVRSTDGGLTWSKPRTLNTDPANKGASHWFGTLSVASNGRIDACWYDNRANPAISNSALFYTSSYDGGLTWSQNIQLSPYFNPNIGYPNQSKMGDYLGMESDSRGASIVYAATFNGEEDIWFLQVPATVSQPTNATAITTFQGNYNSGVLSDIWSPDGKVYTIDSTQVSGLGSVSAAQTDFTLPVSDISGLSIKLNARTSITTTAMVWLWNWKTNAYDYQNSVGTVAGIPVDTTIPISNTISPYLAPNGKVRSLVRFIDPSRQGARPFTAKFDLIQLLFG